MNAEYLHAKIATYACLNVKMRSSTPSGRDFGCRPSSLEWQSGSCVIVPVPIKTPQMVLQPGPFVPKTKNIIWETRSLSSTSLTIVAHSNLGFDLLRLVAASTLLGSGRDLFYRQWRPMPGPIFGLFRDI